LNIFEFDLLPVTVWPLIQWRAFDLAMFRKCGELHKKEGKDENTTKLGFHGAD
jgi:hypothetical protein